MTHGNAKKIDRRPKSPETGADSAIERATSDVAWRLDTVAATENASAFNAEHSRQTRLIARDAPELLAAALFKLWDASLDRRSCSACGLQAGEIRHLGLSFSSGHEPGAIHPRCRCRTGLVFLPVVGNRGRN